MGDTLLGLLRSGGFILYARHGEATIGKDQPFINFQKCFTQRNLSEEGRRQASIYGQTLRNLQIPISYPVITSPFCRTIETAAWAFGIMNICVDPFWVSIYNLERNISNSERSRTLTNLRSILEITPPQGTNRVIIAHSFPKGMGLDEIPNMGTVVIQPKGAGNGYDIVKRLSLGELVDLLE